MSRIIESLAPEPRKALVVLSMFRFLTVQQFVRLGIAASETVMRDYVLCRLERRARPLSKSRKLGSFLPKVHYLTRHGAEELAKLYRRPLQEIPYPVGKVQFGELFARHRFAQIDFHIGWRQWLHQHQGAEFLFADMDFDVTGNRRHGTFAQKSRIDLSSSDEFVIADGIFGFEMNGQPMVYLLEVHRQTETTRVAHQIAKYIKVIKGREILYKYRLNVSPLIFSVHKKERVLRGTKAHLLNIPEFAPYRGAFIFNTLEQVSEDFTQGWHFADDAPADPFPMPNTPNPEPFIE